VEFDTYVIASDTHFGHAVRTRHFELYAELVLRNVHLGRHFASLQTDTVHGQRADAGVLRRFVHPQMQVTAREPIPFERFQCKFFGPTGKTRTAQIRLLFTPTGNDTGPKTTSPPHSLQESQVIGQLGRVRIVHVVRRLESFERDLKVRQSGVDVVVSARRLDERLRYTRFKIYLNLKCE